MTRPTIQQLNEAVAAESERCARLCEEKYSRFVGSASYRVAKECANDIRATAKRAVINQAARLAIVTDEAIAMFNSSRLVKQNGGLLAAVHPTVGRANRQAQVKRCIKVARDICKAVFKSDVITPEFFATYWDECWSDEFLSGRGEKSRQHANWMPAFDYLTRPDVMLKVFEKAMANQEGV